jgi:hypothetical protein
MARSQRVLGAVTLRLVKLDWLRFALPGEQKAG